jgi:hypothetical protein
MKYTMGLSKDRNNMIRNGVKKSKNMIESPVMGEDKAANSSETVKMRDSRIVG